MNERRYHIIIASIIFAVVGWISINMADEYTIVRHIPVVLENMRQGHALRHPVPKTIDVWFRGHGWQLATLYASPDVRYFIDLSSVGTENFVVTRRDLLEHIKLPVSLQPIDVKPDTLILALDEYREKRLPVIPHIVLDFHDGYGQVGAVKIHPDSVTIGGSLHLLENVAGWPTIYRKLNDLRASVDEEVSLEEPATYSLQPFTRSVRVQVGIQPFAEKVFTSIPVSVTGTLTNREVIVIPPKMDLIVRGGIEQLAKLTNADFKAAIEFTKLLRDSTDYVIPAISSPPDVKIVGRKPERFQFIIRKRL